MKKIALFTALIALAFAANAQSLNVQNDGHEKRLYKQSQNRHRQSLCP